MVMRWNFEVLFFLPSGQRRFEVFAKDEREALERCIHAVKHERGLEDASVVFNRGAVAPRGAW